MSHENSQVMKVPSLSEIKETVVSFVHTQWSRLERNMEERVLNPINNYLKTSEEMEEEFSHQVNFDVILASEPNGAYAHFIEHKDGYINIHDPEMVKKGFMEENY